MFDELQSAINAYQGKWQALCSGRKDAVFFNSLRPTSIGWKVTDRAEYDKLYALWHDAAEHIHEVWLNERYIATFYLRDELTSGIKVVKLMQRRPNSTDAVGLDHMDFYTADDISVVALHAKEPDLEFSEEHNGLCAWTSLWFDGTEAKLRNETVLAVSAKELMQIDARLRA
ncbi:MAG TPA: hypothetical protein VIM53_03890 [Candidatus Saccharimonadales bacterium]